MIDLIGTAARQSTARARCARRAGSARGRAHSRAAARRRRVDAQHRADGGFPRRARQGVPASRENAQMSGSRGAATRCGRGGCLRGEGFGSHRARPRRDWADPDHLAGDDAAEGRSGDRTRRRRRERTTRRRQPDRAQPCSMRRRASAGRIGRRADRPGPPARPHGCARTGRCSASSPIGSRRIAARVARLSSSASQHYAGQVMHIAGHEARTRKVADLLEECGRDLQGTARCGPHAADHHGVRHGYVRHRLRRARGDRPSGRQLRVHGSAVHRRRRTRRRAARRFRSVAHGCDDGDQPAGVAA